MVSLEYISVPSPNGARPIYRSADCVIRHEGGWGLTIVRVPAGRDRDRDRIRTMSATNGESFRLQLEEYTFSRYKSKCRVGKSFGNGSGGPLSTCFVWGRRWIRNSKIIRSEIVAGRDTGLRVGGKMGVEGTLIRSRRRIHLSRSSDRLPIVYGIKSCSRFKRSP